MFPIHVAVTYHLTDTSQRLADFSSSCVFVTDTGHSLKEPVISLWMYRNVCIWVDVFEFLVMDFFFFNHRQEEENSKIHLLM